MSINIINHQYAYCCLLFGDLLSSCPPTLSLIRLVCAASRCISSEGTPHKLQAFSTAVGETSDVL